MGFLQILAGAMSILEVSGVLPRVRGYLSPQRRTSRALLFVQLAKDALSLIHLQRGTSDTTDETIRATIDMLAKQLVREGVKAANATAIAERVLAGVVRDQGGVAKPAL